MKNKRKYKFTAGIQRIEMDTPDYSKAYNLQAEKNAQRQGITQAAGAFSGAYKPIADVGSMAGNVIRSNNKSQGGAVAGGAVEMGATGAALGMQVGGPWGAAIGAGAGAIYGGVTGSMEYKKGKKLQEQAERDVALTNANKKFKETSNTSAQSYLAKRGKYKLRTGTSTFKQPRMIETEGREPIFSPKKADGTRDLLYYNPNDPTHEEGGVKAVVMPKNRYNNGTSNLMPKRPASKYSLVGNGMMAKGVQKTKAAAPKFVAPQQKMSHTDSVAHQVDKILKYEQLRGGPGGAPLPQYSDPKYKKMLMDKIYPEVSKIMPNASAMEKGEAMDLVFNSGWDDNSGKITLDPRAYALQEYYRKNDPSKLDAEGNWAGRKGAPYSFDKEYANTIGKLSENERRIMMNKGRDWFYKHRAPKGSTWDLKTQGPHPNYKDTWYGRIWNTNDFSPFNPNNPAFIPKKAAGSKQLKVNTLNDTVLFSNLGGMPAVNAANKFIQPMAGKMQVARQIPEYRRKEKQNTPRSHKKENPDTNRIIDPPMLYEMKPPAPRSTFNTKNDYNKGSKKVKVYR